MAEPVKPKINPATDQVVRLVNVENIVNGRWPLYTAVAVVLTVVAVLALVAIAARIDARPDGTVVDDAG